jgi:hypothetical protein
MCGVVTCEKCIALQTITPETVGFEEPVVVDGVALSPLTWGRLRELRKPTLDRPDGLKIWAVKTIRDETGLGLMRSKEIADMVWPLLSETVYH